MQTTQKKSRLFFSLLQSRHQLTRDGRDEHLAKRRRILLGTAHLLEIDLLRNGSRVPLGGRLPPLPDFVFLSRADR